MGNYVAWAQTPALLDLHRLHDTRNTLALEDPVSHAVHAHYLKRTRPGKNLLQVARNVESFLSVMMIEREPVRRLRPAFCAGLRRLEFLYGVAHSFSCETIARLIFSGMVEVIRPGALALQFTKAVFTLRAIVSRVRFVEVPLDVLFSSAHNALLGSFACNDFLHWSF